MYTLVSHRGYFHHQSNSHLYLKIILFTFWFSFLYSPLMVQYLHATSSSDSSYKSSPFSFFNVNKIDLLPKIVRPSSLTVESKYSPNKYHPLGNNYKSNRSYLFISSSPVQMMTKRNTKKVIININKNYNKRKMKMFLHSYNPRTLNTGGMSANNNPISSSSSSSSSNSCCFNYGSASRSYSNSRSSSNRRWNSSRGNSYNYKHHLLFTTAPSLQRVQSVSFNPNKSNFLIFSATSPNEDLDDIDERDGSSNGVTSSSISSPSTTSSSTPLSPSSSSSSFASSATIDNEGNIITKEAAEGVFTSLFTNDRRPVILFDGICSFCNGGINLLSDLDTTKNLRFATLQSDLGKSLLVYCNRETDDISSIIVIERNGRYHTRSDAMLTILENTYMFPPTEDTKTSTETNGNNLKNLQKNGRETNESLSLSEIGLRNFLISCFLPSIGRKIPRFLRDGAYEVVSENRYRFLGVKDECRIIDEEEDDRFLA